MKKLLFIVAAVVLFFQSNLNANNIILENVYMKLFLTPAKSHMDIDEQYHVRTYSFSGSAVLQFEGSNTAFNPENYEFTYKLQYNWVTGEYNQKLEITNSNQTLDYNAYGHMYSMPSDNIFTLDPVIYFSAFNFNEINESGSIYNYLPKGNYELTGIGVFISSPNWYDGELTANNYTTNIGYHLAKKMKLTDYWRLKVYNRARMLNFINAQDQYFTKGSKILLVANQYIPDDIYNGEYDYKRYFLVGSGYTNLPLFFYGTKARLSFQYIGDMDNVHFGDAIQFSKEINMHGNNLIYNLDTSNMLYGKWKVTAQITQMGNYAIKEYPVSDPLYFTINQKLNLWGDFDCGSLTLNSAIDYQNISLKAPAPTSQMNFKYLPVSIPVIAPKFEETLPLALDTENNMKFALPDADKPVDVFLGFSVPGDSNVYLLYPDNTIHSLSEGLKAWKTNIKEIINETVFPSEAISKLPKGMTIDAYIVVTPHNDLTKYYFWKTFIVTNH